jgi:hypothetical protein
MFKGWYYFQLLMTIAYFNSLLFLETLASLPTSLIHEICLYGFAKKLIFIFSATIQIFIFRKANIVTLSFSNRRFAYKI